MMNKFALQIVLIVALWMCHFNGLNAQTTNSLSLKEAYLLLEKNYPNLQNSELLNQIHQKELEQLDIAKLPSIFLKADARLQSESVKLDAEGSTPLPFDINQPLVSFKTYAEANYVVLDGGMNEAQRTLKEAQLKVNQQNIEVERYKLRERINQLFLTISLLREQSKVFDISLKDLEARRTQIAAGVEYGVVLESELTKLQVKEMELQSQQNQLAFQLSGMIGTLATLTGMDLPDNIELVFPAMSKPLGIPSINRPEQEYLRLQRGLILAQSDLITAARKPKLNAFAQTGFGYPNPLNMLDNNPAPFALIGAGFSWQITDWKKEKLDKSLLTLQAQQLQNQQETFDFNLQSKEANYLANIQRIYAQIEADEKIAGLQADILQSLAVQLEEGVINTTEYILQVNAELLARQQLIVHQTELLQTQLEFWNERGSLE
ncbi:MAG: TolC family protein [Chitinophagales bacterium]